MWGSVRGSALCSTRIEWVREGQPKSTKESASSRGKLAKPGLLTLERRWVWWDHNFLMNLSSKEQRWVWNLVTWKWGSNLLKRKAFVSRKPKALWMVLVVPQNNQGCSSDLLNTLCPGGSADGWAMSFVLQEVKFLLCHSRAKGWSNLWGAMLLELLLEKKQRSWDQQQGWGISTWATHLLHSSGQLVLSDFFHYVVCSCVPKGKKLYVCPLCSL